MKLYGCIVVALAILPCCSCAKPTPDTLHTGGYDEQEMDQAIARARSEVDQFIAQLAAGNGEEFAVKVPIKEKDQVEHFWLTKIEFRDGEFHGEIGNDPGIVSNVKLGQPYTIAKSEITDWMFMRDGKIHGNYTMRPMLKTMPPNEAEQLRSMLADP